MTIAVDLGRKATKQRNCDCYCSVTLPHGTVGWFAVCNYDIP